MIIISDPNEEISEKSARDFKDAMESIETSGKMGTFTTFSAFLTLVMDIIGSPFIKNWTDLFKLMQRFFDMGGAEAAAKWRAELFSEQNIKDLEAMAAGWRLVSNAITDTMLGIKAALAPGGALDIPLQPIIDKWVEDINKFFNTIGKTMFQGLGSEAVVGIKTGFIAALKDIDWEDIIKDIIEDHFD